MRSAAFAILFGSSALIAAGAVAQTAAPSASAPADLCQELLAYAEKAAAEAPKQPSGQAPAPAAAPPPRADGQATGTQGGGSVGPNASTDTSAQQNAPPTAPTSSGAEPEAAASPHASGSSSGAAGRDLDGGVTLQQVREASSGGERQACRDMTQKLRRAGAELPAALIALAAYEPDPAKRR